MAWRGYTPHRACFGFAPDLNLLRDFCAVKVLDPYKASYGVDDYVWAVTQLAQTTMRSEIGKIELDKTFEEREALNNNIVSQINEAAGPWGVMVLRYEIKDIEPPRTVLDAMERQMKAEREKRASILESEGERQSSINVAEGEKRSRVLAAEAEKAEQILKAEGEANAIITTATTTTTTNEENPTKMINLLNSLTCPPQLQLCTIAAARIIPQCYFLLSST